MNQKKHAKHFADLHVRGNPLMLYNAWDAGSAKAIVEAGAKAIATSSWSVAAAQGYQDGESIPIEFVEQIIARITATIDVPVSVDFEGGYTENDNELGNNVSRLLDLGIIGINFEDRVVNGTGLYEPAHQAKRIAKIRQIAERKGVDLFINARTDVFFGEGDPASLVKPALDRAKEYAAAGASGFFIPGLLNSALISKICAGTTLPVNVMVMEGAPSNRRLSDIGVARISYGPIPYVLAMSALQRNGTKILS